MSFPTRLDEVCKLLVDGTKTDKIIWSRLKAGGHAAPTAFANFILTAHGDPDNGLTGLTLRIVSDDGMEIDTASVGENGPDDDNLQPLDQLFDLICDQEERRAVARLSPILEALRRQVTMSPPKPTGY
jgi:hypothetical protein